MDDIRAVMDAAGSARADVFGWSEGANIAAVFGASRPDRVSALVLYGAFPRGTPDEGYPWAIVPEAWELSMQEDEEETWGQGFSLLNLAPSQIRRRGARALVGAVRAPVDEPQDGARGDSPRHEHRHPRCRAEHPCSDARHPSHRGRSAGRRRALARAAHPRRTVRRAAGRRPLALGRGPGRRSSTRSRSSSPASARAASPTACSRRCSSPTSSARPSAPRELGDRRWRELLERHHAVVRARAGPLPRPRDRHRGRRLPRHLRRAARGDPLRAAIGDAVRGARARDPRRAPHGRVRADRRRRRRHRRAHRRARAGAGRGRRGARLEHGDAISSPAPASSSTDRGPRR